MPNFTCLYAPPVRQRGRGYSSLAFQGCSGMARQGPSRPGPWFGVAAKVTHSRHATPDPGRLPTPAVALLATVTTSGWKKFRAPLPAACFFGFRPYFWPARPPPSGVVPNLPVAVLGRPPPEIRSRNTSPLHVHGTWGQNPSCQKKTPPHYRSNLKAGFEPLGCAL